MTPRKVILDIRNILNHHHSDNIISKAAESILEYQKIINAFD